MTTYNDKLYQEQVALVTGGTSGIGNAVAIQLANLGAKVYAVGLESEETKVPDNLDIEPVELDVTDEEAVKEFFDKLNKLDILFNGAGNSGMKRDVNNFKLTLNIHLVASHLFSELARPLLKNSDNGSIINTSSMTAIFGQAGGPAYSSAKGGIDQLTKTHAIEYAEDGIRVNAVAPGWITTPLVAEAIPDEVQESIIKRTPQSRLGDPEEIATVVAFLASPAASHVNGVILPIDGGYSVTGEIV